MLQQIGLGRGGEVDALEIIGPGDDRQHQHDILADDHVIFLGAGLEPVIVLIRDHVIGNDLVRRGAHQRFQDHAGKSAAVFSLRAVDQIGRLLFGQEGQAADDPLGEVLGLEGDRQRKGNDPAVFIKAPVIIRGEVFCRKAALKVLVRVRQIHDGINARQLCQLVCIGRAAEAVVGGRGRAIQPSLGDAAHHNGTEIGKDPVKGVIGAAV